MIEIKNLEGISFEQIYTAFKSAFSDYEISVDKTELKSMLKRRGFNPALSFGAFYDDNIVAFTFNGIVNTIMANLLHTIRNRYKKRVQRARTCQKNIYALYAIPEKCRYRELFA